MSVNQNNQENTGNNEESMKEKAEKIKIKAQETAQQMNENIKAGVSAVSEEIGKTATDLKKKFDESVSPTSLTFLIKLLTNPDDVYSDLKKNIDIIETNIKPEDKKEGDKSKDANKEANTSKNEEKGEKTIDRAINYIADEYKEIIKNHDTQTKLLKFVDKSGQIILVKVPKIIGIIINNFLTVLGGIPFIGIPITFLRFCFNMLNGVANSLDISKTAIEASSDIGSIPNIEDIKKYFSHINEIFSSLSDESTLKEVLDGINEEKKKENEKKKEGGSDPSNDTNNINQKGGKKIKKIRNIYSCIENSLKEFKNTTNNPKMFLKNDKMCIKR